MIDERGDQTPVAFIPRDRRYVEKLATPDVTIADLIGDRAKQPATDEREPHRLTRARGNTRSNPTRTTASAPPATTAAVRSTSTSKMNVTVPVTSRASEPIASRIISTCDAYDAMTSDRPYRAAMSHDVAVAELQSCSGGQFDPDAVDAVIEAVPSWLELEQDLTLH